MNGIMQEGIATNMSLVEVFFVNQFKYHVSIRTGW